VRKFGCSFKKSIISRFGNVDEVQKIYSALDVEGATDIRDQCTVMKGVSDCNIPRFIKF
jgi:hypothetical protein